MRSILRISITLLLILWSSILVYSQCSTISNLSFYTSSVNSCNIPQTINCYPQYQLDQTPIALKSYTANFKSKHDIDFPMDKNGCVYVLKISGSFTIWGNSNEYFDGYGDFNKASNNLIKQDSKLIDFFSLSPDSGPTAYDPSHVYYFYFTGNSTNLNFKFTDSNYSDNSGSVTIEWYVIPCFTYVWDFGNASTSTDSIGVTTYTSPGIYTITYTIYDDANGCDESYSLQLTFLPSNNVSLTLEICNGEAVTIGNSVYSQSGNYSDTLVNQYGCDSIVSLSLSVVSSQNNYIDTLLCSGQSIIVGSNIYSQSGTYSDTLTSKGGCDSIINLTLAVLPTYQTYIDTILCNGGSYLLGTTSYNTTGSYSYMFTSSQGCDSMVYLDLNVSNAVKNTLEAYLCSGESYTLGNNTYSISGIYSETFATASGCDSIVELNLTVKDTFFVALAYSICEGEEVEINNVYYNISGNYLDTLSSIDGCDSIIQLNLIVSDTSIAYQNLSICEGEAFVVGSNMYTNPGNYTDVFQNINGCDSIIITQLEVHSRPQSSLADSIFLCADDSVTLYPGSFDNYTWSNGSNDSAIVVSEAGNYQLIISDANLCSTIDEVEVYDAGCTSLFIPVSFTPNNDGLNDYFNAIGFNVYEYQLKIFDSWGNALYETNEFNTKKNEANGWGGQNTPQGIYVWQLSYREMDGEGRYSLKRMNGVVSLIK